jgi:hypothetical protein
MPLLEENIATNSTLFRSSSVTPKAAVLNWDDEALPTEVLKICDSFDVIMYAHLLSIA